MAAPLGQRTYRLSILAIILASILYLVSVCLVFLLKDPGLPTAVPPVPPERVTPIVFLYIGLGIGGMLGILSVPGMGKLAIEWLSRGKDQSSISDQMRADRTRVENGAGGNP